MPRTSGKPTTWETEVRGGHCQDLKHEGRAFAVRAGLCLPPVSKPLATGSEGGAVAPPPRPSGPPGAIEAVGVDGCPAGWIAALALIGDDGARRTQLELHEGLVQLIERVRPAEAGAVIAVDVPIGLPDRIGDRPCDRAARARLRHPDRALRRASSVFSVPDREVLALATFEEVQELVRRRRAENELGVKGLTIQAHNISRKIAEADAVVRAYPGSEGWLIEVHPEVSFRALAGSALPYKKRPEGRKQRLDTLRHVFPDIENACQLAKLPASQAGRDDILDAFVGLWSALRFRAGTHETLGEGERDACDVPMRMVV